MIKCLSFFLFSLFSVHASQDLTQQPEQAHIQPHISTIPWIGYANGWFETKRQYQSPENQQEKIDKLTEMVRFFFTPGNLTSQPNENKIYVTPSDLAFIGHFLYEMTFFYDRQSPDHPWGHFQIISPIDSKLEWRSVWLRIYKAGMDSLIDVTFYPTEESA